MADPSDVTTPIYDALVQELGDPVQRGEAFDQSLVDLDAYIDQTLHDQAQVRPSSTPPR